MVIHMKKLKALTPKETTQVSGAGRRTLQPSSEVVSPKTPVTLDPRAPVDGIYPPPALAEM